MILQLRHTSFITQSLKEMHSGRETGLIDTGPFSRIFSILSKNRKCCHDLKIACGVKEVHMLWILIGSTLLSIIIIIFMGI